MMNSLTIRTACLWSLAIFFCLTNPVDSPAQSQAGQPQAVIEETGYNFGDIFSGEEVSHAFAISNTGNAPLELSETRRLISSRSREFLLPAASMGKLSPTPARLGAAPS
jgi:hypothetical protein